MADDPEKDAHTVGTVPPPPGGDAYEEPTRVGAVSSALWRAMNPHIAGEALANADAPPAPSSERTPPTGVNITADALPEQTAAAGEEEAPASGFRPQEPVPLVYDANEAEGDSTLLHPAAKRFSLPRPSLPPPRPSFPPMTVTTGPMTFVTPSRQPPPVPNIVGPAPNDTAWPFAPALVGAGVKSERRQAIAVAIAAALVGVLAAVAIWRWLL